MLDPIIYPTYTLNEEGEAVVSEKNTEQGAILDYPSGTPTCSTLNGDSGVVICTDAPNAISGTGSLCPGGLKSTKTWIVGHPIDKDRNIVWHV